MKLMTKAIEKKFKKYPLYSQETKGLDAEVVVKFFNPCGSTTILVTEGEKQEQENDWLFFGYIKTDYEYEWGFIRLSDFENIKLPFGLKFERDICSEGTVRELM